MENEFQNEYVEENEIQVHPGESENSEEHGPTFEQFAHVVDKVCETYDGTLNVSKELKEYREILPETGHAFRETLIREAADMSTQEKLAASRDNDDYELERLNRVKDMANDTRDNKTKNAVTLLAIYVLPAAFGIAMCFPGSRAIIVAGIKSGMKLIPHTISAA